MKTMVTVSGVLLASVVFAGQPTARPLAETQQQAQTGRALPPSGTGIHPTVTRTTKATGANPAAMPTPTRPLPRLGRTARIGGLELDSANFPFPTYIDRMVGILSLNWYKPEQAPRQSPVVHFLIQRDGTITNPFLVRSSGLPYVDRAAIRAVLASSPLRPLPPEFGAASLGVKVVFE